VLRSKAWPVPSAQGVPPLNGDRLRFDARPDPVPDALIDLPLQDREAPPAAPSTPVSPQRASRRGLGAGLLAIGLITGFVAGFMAGQRVAPPAPRASAAEAVAPVREPAVVPAQPFTESPVDELPSVVDTAPAADIRPRVEAAPEPLEVSEPLEVPERTEPTGAPRRTGTPAVEGSRDEPGTLELISRPPGAQVYVDEVPVGITPIAASKVGPGVHRVRFELAGHQPWTTTVAVDPGAVVRVGASLEP
jgi:hypothetical protein